MKPELGDFASDIMAALAAELADSAPENRQALFAVAERMVETLYSEQNKEEPRR